MKRCLWVNDLVTKDWDEDTRCFNGWCFLDNVQDPKNPRANCFKYAHCSISNGFGPIRLAMPSRRMLLKVKLPQSVWASHPTLATSPSPTRVWSTTLAPDKTLKMDLLGAQWRWENEGSAYLIDNEFPQVNNEGEVINNGLEDWDDGCPGN